jgi:mRNA (2'-O-methyladenosine-N6-)-methyltransferase
MMATTTMEIISSASELLATHSMLINNVRLSQQYHRRQLHLLHSPPHELLKLPLISTPPPSPPSDSPPTSPVSKTQQPLRTELPPAKRARVSRFANYVPEEETIRNDYSQRYVDSGEWSQNWVLGAEPEHRFEECVVLWFVFLVFFYSHILGTRSNSASLP